MSERGRRDRMVAGFTNSHVNFRMERKLQNVEDYPSIIYTKFTFGPVVCEILIKRIKVYRRQMTTLTTLTTTVAKC